MKERILKEQKGFATSDALIAVLIIALFAGLIATISYNIYLSNSSIKRMSKATSYIVDVFEYVDKSYYDEVTEENIITYFNEKYYYQEDKVTKRENAEVKAGLKEETEELDTPFKDTPFKVEIDIVKYNETEGNTDKLDLVKEVTITVRYKLGNKEQKIPMTHTKSRENLDTPNAPEISLIEEDGQKVYPIKKVNSAWKVCDKSDNSWYDYTSGKWALVIKTNQELSIGQEINSDSQEIYAWIPRYAYTNDKIVFLLSNSDKYIENTDQENEDIKYNSLKSIEENYTIPNDFYDNGKPVIGVWTNDTSLGIYQTLNDIYPLSK